MSSIFPHGPAEIGGGDSPRDENPSVLAHPLGPMDHADLSYDPDAAWAKLRSRQIFQAPATVEAAVGGRPAGSVRVVAVSDTHGLHRGVALPRGDILVHCGDFTDTGMPNQVRDFTLWLLEAKAAGGFAHVVVIAGNHDTTFHESYYRETGADRFHRRAHGAVDPVATKAILTTATHGDNSGHATSTSPSSPSPPPNGITYLEDELVALPFAHLGPHPSSGGGGGGARVPLGAPLSSAQAAAAAAASALASAPAALAAPAAATAAATVAAAVVTVYGTPWQPEFGGWAFNLDRGPPCRAIWDRIPAAHPGGGGDATGGEDGGGGGGGETSRGTIGGSDSGSGNGSSSSSSIEAAAPRRAVDVLLSHGPPLGRGDRLGLPVAAGLPAAGPAAGLQGLEEEEEERRRSGCVDLLRRVQGAVQPLAHVFGHIHEDAGEVSGDGATAYANACTCTCHYQSLNPAIVFDLVFELVFDLVFDDGHGGGGHGHGGGGGNDGGGSDSGGNDSGENDSGENDGGSGRGRGPHPHALPPLRPSRVTFVASRVRGWGASRVGVWLDAQAAALLAQAQAADPAGAGVGGGGGGGRPRVTADAAAAETETATETAAAAAAAAAGPGSASWLLPCAAAVVALRGLDGPGLLALRPDDARLRPLERQATARTIRAIRHLEAAETN